MKGCICYLCKKKRCPQWAAYTKKNPKDLPGQMLLIPLDCEESSGDPAYPSQNNPENLDSTAK